jgi:hypothetical protein
MISIVSSTISASSGVVSSFQVPVNNEGPTGVTNVAIVSLPSSVSVDSIIDDIGTLYTMQVSRTDPSGNSKTEIWATAAGAAPGGNFSTVLATVNLSVASKVVASLSEWSGVVSLGTATSLDDAGAEANDLSVSNSLLNVGNVIVAGFSWQGIATASAKTGTLRSSVETSGHKAANVGGALTFNSESGVEILLSAASYWSVAALQLNSI